MLNIKAFIPLMVAGVLFISVLIGGYASYGTHRYQTVDRSSVANINEIRTEHIALDLTVNFLERRLYGNIVHTFVAVASDVKQIHLDIENIKVHGVFDASTSKSLSYKIKEWPWITDESNQVLTINLKKPLNYQEKIMIRIEYNTEPNGLGMNWLNENQTGTHQPFFYTDCQTYYCRSLAPLQDTPAVKAPFTSKIKVPKPLIALSSGHPISEKEVEDNMREYVFNQPNPVPSYLIAVLAGVLERRAIDHRTFVYAEPGIIDHSVEVLSDIGSFLNIIESALIPYRWGYYSVVVMPFGYPNGGMENPQITFMSPSIIKAGKDAVHVAAHEIAHSWFGNLVTCGNWSHTWLNEGFTVYSERMIVQEFFGQEFYEQCAHIGMYDLEKEIEAGAKDDDEEPTKLLCFPNRLCPEYCFTSVQYEKGFVLVQKLERLTGKQNFFEFLKTYLLKHQYESVMVEDLKAEFTDFVMSKLKNGSDIIKAIDWEKELRGPGLPDPMPVFTNPKIKAAQQLAAEYIKKNGESPEHPERYHEFNSKLKMIFMIGLTKGNAPEAVVERVDSDLEVTKEENNPDILLYWLVLNIPKRLDAVKIKVIEYVGSYGRGKYLYPVYRLLAKADKEFGRSLFKKYGENYNPKVAENINSLLK